MEIKAYKGKVVGIGGVKVGKRLIYVDPEEEQIYCWREKSSEWKMYDLGDGGTNFRETVSPEEFNKRFGVK